MQIIEELRSGIPNKEKRLKKAGVSNIIKEHQDQIADYDGVITPRNIVLTVNQAESFRNKTIPNIMEFHDRVHKALEVLEEELNTWGDMNIEERNRLVKTLSAMQTIEDISLEVKEIMEQVVKNIITRGKIIQILAPELIRLGEIFELNDVCIDNAHEILHQFCKLSYIAKNNGDGEKFKIIIEKDRKVTQSIADINFPSIRSQISAIEELFVNKYTNIKILRIDI